MEKFFAGQVAKLITTIRSGSDEEIEEMLLFCESWGGPLGAAAEVGLSWVVERRSWGEQQGLTETAEISAAFPEPQVEQQEGQKLGKICQALSQVASRLAEPQVEQQLQLPVAPTEPPRPTPDWVKEALARKAG